MKHLKLFENFNTLNDDFLLNIYKNGIINGKQEIIDLAVSKGFDVETNKEKMVEWCEIVNNYHAIKYIDETIYLEKIEVIRYLVLDQVKLKNLKGISCLINIEELVIDESTIESLKGIENLINLKELVCVYGELESLEELEKLEKLEKLILHTNKIKSLKGIENLTNLKELDCYDNELESLEEIKQLINLENLDCNNNIYKDEKLNNILKQFYDEENSHIYKKNIDIIRNYYNKK